MFHPFEQARCFFELSVFVGDGLAGVFGFGRGGFDAGFEGIGLGGGPAAFVDHLVLEGVEHLGGCALSLVAGGESGFKLGDAGVAVFEHDCVVFGGRRGACGELSAEAFDFGRQLFDHGRLYLGEFYFVEEAFVFEVELFALGFEGLHLRFEVLNAVGEGASAAVGAELLFLYRRALLFEALFFLSETGELGRGLVVAAPD